MVERPSLWLLRVLFLLGVASAAGLFLLVFGAPLLDNGGTSATGWPRVVAVFARDATLRRTALASGLGLVVTACVFFRPPPGARRVRNPRLPPPPDIAGA
jgi:hypothetical protein